MTVAKSWHKEFKAALVQGEGGLDGAVGLYLWARDHIRELHQVDKKFRQDWVIVQIQRVWNIDPEDYVRTAARLGGGTEPHEMEKGRKVIKRFGLHETFRADKMLGPDQMRKIIAKLSKAAGPDAFRKAVDELYEQEIANIKPGKKGPEKGEKVNYRSEYFRLLKRCAELEQKCKDLQRELSWIKRQVKVTKTRKRAVVQT